MQVNTQGKKVKAIGVGNDFSLVIMEDGSLWGFGSNSNGQLGLGTTARASTAMPAIGDLTSNVKSVAGGNAHALALKNDGTVWAFGNNFSGQLGIVSAVPVSTARQVTDLSNDVQAIAVRGFSSLVLKTNGTVWAFGSNNNGQLGLGNNDNSSAVKQVKSLDNDVQAISLGSGYSLILKTNGTVWSSGENKFGQLGSGNTAGTNTTNPVTALGDSVQLISGGGNFTMVIKKDGNLWAFGANNNGQLGLGNNTTPILTPAIVNIP